MLPQWQLPSIFIGVPDRTISPIATEALNETLYHKGEVKHNRRSRDLFGHRGVGCRAGNCVSLGEIAGPAERRCDLGHETRVLTAGRRATNSVVCLAQRILIGPLALPLLLLLPNLHGRNGDPAWFRG